MKLLERVREDKAERVIKNGDKMWGRQTHVLPFSPLEVYFL